MEWWTWVLIVVLVAAVVAVLWAASSLRRDRLRTTFGPEYDRALEGAGSRRDAEAQLRGRLKRYRSLELRPLEPEVAAAYSQRWMGIQAQFVDVPAQACADAEALLDQVLRDRGYPVDEDFATQADLVSVDHPDLVADYREAHEMMHARGDGERRLEDLRSVFVIYRDLFSDLLDHQADQQTVPTASPTSTTEAAPETETDTETEPGYGLGDETRRAS